MFKTLSPGAIQCKPATLDDALALARAGGFEGLEINAGQVADLVDQRGAEAVKQTFAEADNRALAVGG